MEKAVFGAGCFWGVEYHFKRCTGVVNTRVGYSGGASKNPTYEEVCTGLTGHAEVVEVEFDPKKTNFEKLVNYFWRLHDPTQKNGQGADIGTQYRSIIICLNEDQKSIANQMVKEFSSKLNRELATEVVDFQFFTPAEEHHQSYFERNGGPICHVLRPE